MIQGRARADNSPVGSFDATGATEFQPQCNGDVSNITFDIHLNHI